jgi:hydroxymethylpyrimidine/phosphomethylpyrimidine kinase
VLVATSGRSLLDSAGERALRTRLIPAAALVTPNIPEAERLAGIAIDSEDALRSAAVAIHRMGAYAVLIKGGHPISSGKRHREVVDLFYDGRRFHRLAARRISNVDLHGGGCVLSASIAARLALGDGILDAVIAARQVMDRVIAGRIRLGEGREVMGTIAAISPHTNPASAVSKRVR